MLGEPAATSAYPQGAWDYHDGLRLIQTTQPRKPLRVLISNNEHDLYSAGPCTQVIDGPPPRSGRNIVTFKFRAVQAKAATGNCTTDDESLLDPVLGATFEVQMQS